MRTLHFDCFSGISGDMTLAALFDLGVDQSAVVAAIKSLGLPIKIEVEKVRKNGLAATQVLIEAPTEHKHRHLPHIEKILAAGALTESQRDLAVKIFRNLAAAEAAVHGVPIEKVHFHEVGALDSIADIAGVAVALDLLKVERFTSRSVVAGSGTVKCDHGVMPVPAPATAELLKAKPLAACKIAGELTTPTGAAFLATLVNEWTDGPAMTIEKIGLGAGRRELLEQPNVLRLLLGESQANPGQTDAVWLLETNLDDVTGEIVGYTMERLFEAGALDVWLTPIQMKKNRPGVMVSVLGESAKVAELENVLFRETGTFGVRRTQVFRTKLERESVSVDSPWGPVLGKRGIRNGQSIITPEYEDAARIAKANNIALRDLYFFFGLRETSTDNNRDA